MTDTRHTDCCCCEHALVTISRLRASMAIKDKALEVMKNAAEAAGDEAPYQQVTLCFTYHGRLTRKLATCSVSDLRDAAQALHTAERKDG